MGRSHSSLIFTLSHFTTQSFSYSYLLLFASESLTKYFVTAYHGSLSYQPRTSISLFSAAWPYSLGFYFRKPHFEYQFLYYSGQDSLCCRNKITPKSQWPEQTEVYMSLVQSPAWVGPLYKAAPGHVVNLGSQILLSYHLNLWPLWLLMIVTGKLHKMFLMAKHGRSDLCYFYLLPIG